MIKNNRKIEIVSSSKSYLSSMSKPSREAIFDVLSKHYSRVSIRLIDTIEDLEDLVARRPDIVVLGMKFVPVDPALGLQDTNRIWLSSYLDKHDIAYTGSGQLAHELDCDKTLAKQALLSAGIATSPFCLIKQGQLCRVGGVNLSYPLFIKPVNRGGGLGIDSNSVVNNFTELSAKVSYISDELGSDSLIERYLPGREFSVAIIKDSSSSRYSSVPVELIAEPDIYGNRILGEATKSANTEQVLAVADTKIKDRVSELALSAFRTLGARDYGRIDIRLDNDDTPHFLEANLIPSLISGYGTFPKACKIGLDIEYETLIHRLVNLAMLRAEENIQPFFRFIATNNDLQSSPR